MTTTTTTNQLRKGAAALALPVPVLVHPRAPPAPVLGQGPGKRVQVQGNSRQNVSISSIFLMIYWLTSVICPVMLFFFIVFSFLISPSVALRNSMCRLIDLTWYHFILKYLWHERNALWTGCTAGVLHIAWQETCRCVEAILVEAVLPLWTEAYLNPPALFLLCMKTLLFFHIVFFKWSLTLLLHLQSELTCSILMELL